MQILLLHRARYGVLDIELVKVVDALIERLVLLH